MFSMHNPEVAKLSRSVFSYRTLDGCLWSSFVRKIASSLLLKSMWINMQNIYIKTDAKLFSCINILITCHRLTMNVLHDHCEKWDLSKFSILNKRKLLFTAALQKFHFRPMFLFVSPWKHHKIKGFLMLPGGNERKH